MLYHFLFELSDIDQSIYATLDFRTAQHPSETPVYLLTRVLAYALSYTENLEFSLGGLSEPEAPALKSLGLHGTIDLWIEIGNPSFRKLHKATKTAKQVVVYTYKNAELLTDEIKINSVHKGNEIKVFSFEPDFLIKLEKLIEKNNRWQVLIHDKQLSVTVNEQTVTTLIKEHLPKN